ncbi:MAG: PRC-barrel domain-containing protein [Bacteroidota bacterium]
MALVRLQDVDWTLTDKRQDIRGRELRDAVGRSLGEIEHMIVDTEQQRVVSVSLTDGTEYPADDLQIMEEAVYFIPPDAPSIDDVSVARSKDAETSAEDPTVPPPEVDPEASDPAIPSPPEGDGGSELASAGPESPAVAPPAVGEPAADPAIPSAPDPVEEPMPAPAAAPQAPGAYLDADFKNHFEAEYEDRRLRFGDLQFAYRFGFDASRTPRLAERDLPDVETDLRRVFYARFNYPVSDELVWMVAGDAIRYGFRLGKR